MSILLSHQCWTHGLPYPEKKMAKTIEKVALLVHYIDGSSDIGFSSFPVSVTGQQPSEYFTLWREDGIEVLVNLRHVIRLEQSIIYKE